MKKNSQFQSLLGKFLSEYLPNRKNYSVNTIASYCDTFKILLTYLKRNGLEPNNIKFSNINKDTIDDFLYWLETDKKCLPSTINQRLAGIHSFYKFVQNEEPMYINLCQLILNIPNRKYHTKFVSYLEKEQLKVLLEQPNTSTKKGRRDLTLISVLYDTGARVQEISDLCINSIRLDAPAQITLKGKGGKSRIVPLMKNTAKLLENYLKENNLLNNDLNHPVFFNCRKEKLTRYGITYILQKYMSLAHKKDSTMPTKISPHILRHSKAMHLLEAGVNIVYIRDILGHESISTTGIYARSNLEMKRKALQKVNIIPQITDIPYWTEDKDLLSWLQNYSSNL